MTKIDAVTAAEQDLAAAQAALAKEHARLKGADDQVATTTAELEKADPDDAAAFSKLTTALNGHVARSGAIDARVSAAVAAVAAAEKALKGAKLAVQEEALADLAAKIKLEDEACMAEAVAAEERLVARVRGLKALLTEWRELEMARRQAAGTDGPGIMSLSCGSEWSKVGDLYLTPPALAGIRSSRAHMAIYAR